jgi:hypothetical protein
MLPWANHGTVVGSAGLIPRERAASSLGEDLHLVFFCGYSLWIYLTTPFVQTLPNVSIKELEIWHGRASSEAALFDIEIFDAAFE